MDVLNYMNEMGMSPIDAATMFNISSSRLIRIWRHQFETGGLDALVSKKKGCPAMKKETIKNTASTPVEGSALQA
ncbi:helix-turn-helix domain-containing protein [Lysinibacillus sp. NPDC093190]|uniref:helix-turn-helix domain-containing protein n=1 Tax=Lysinibacillus sp. NPDC093190 TaxID=3390575 RepID=UPI003D0572A0